MHQLAIEESRIVEEMGVIGSELLLDSAVETLEMGIRLGMAGVVEEMHEPLLLAGLGEVFEELMAVVGLHTDDGKRSDPLELAEKVPGS